MALRTSNLFTILALVSFVSLCGCGQQQSDMNSTYGTRSGSSIGSVNGTWVLSDMFQEAGYYTSTAKRLSPRILRSDVIVWAPDTFHGPTRETRVYFEDWLTEQDGRTLIYIGRDYDASIDYWEQMQSQATTTDKADFLRQKALARQSYDQRRNLMPEKQDVDWFEIVRDQPQTTARTLQGPWATGVVAEDADIMIRSKYNFPESKENQNVNKWSDDFVLSEVLLKSGKHNIVTRLEDDYMDSRIIVVNNGSFLLNMPLVNPEHRVLAGKLIEECGYGSSVAFLESGEDVQIVHSEDNASGNSGWEWLTVWPLNVSGLHFALLMIVLCFALFPYFGRPRTLPEEPTSDFKKHIDALGQLLEITQDYDYAQLRVKQYQQMTKTETVYRRGRSKNG
ncbi:MAG: hypothetical protein COA78_02535 [Blastopirellula sp.]|nr:MAG: hypothetical protein COA78_02535 [Blastopirellula sp.]